MDVSLLLLYLGVFRWKFSPPETPRLRHVAKILRLRRFTSSALAWFHCAPCVKSCRRRTHLKRTKWHTNWELKTSFVFIGHLIVQGVIFHLQDGTSFIATPCSKVKKSSSPNTFLTQVLIALIVRRLITFRMRRSRGEMYSGHGRLCVCLSVCVTSVPRRIPTVLHGPGCNLGEWCGAL